MDNVIKWKLAGTVIDPNTDTEEPVLSESAAPTAAEAIENFMRSFKKLGLTLGKDITITPTKEHRQYMDRINDKDRAPEPEKEPEPVIEEAAEKPNPKKPCKPRMKKVK